MYAGSRHPESLDSSYLSFPDVVAPYFMNFSLAIPHDSSYRDTPVGIVRLYEVSRSPYPEIAMDGDTIKTALLIWTFYVI